MDQKGTGGAAHVLEQGINGGERNAGTSNNYDATKHEANSYVLQNAATAQGIGQGGTTPVYLMGIHIHTALAGTLTVVGFTDSAGAAASWVIPIGAAGAILPPGNARRCEGGCTMTCSVAADGPKTLVDWRPIG